MNTFKKTNLFNNAYQPKSSPKKKINYKECYSDSHARSLTIIPEFDDYIPKTLAERNCLTCILTTHLNSPQFFKCWNNLLQVHKSCPPRECYDECTEAVMHAKNHLDFYYTANRTKCFNPKYDFNIPQFMRLICEYYEMDVTPFLKYVVSIFCEIGSEDVVRTSIDEIVRSTEDLTCFEDDLCIELSDSLCLPEVVVQQAALTVTPSTTVEAVVTPIIVEEDIDFSNAPIQFLQEDETEQEIVIPEKKILPKKTIHKKRQSEPIKSSYARIARLNMTDFPVLPKSKLITVLPPVPAIISSPPRKVEKVIEEVAEVKEVKFNPMVYLQSLLCREVYRKLNYDECPCTPKNGFKYFCPGCKLTSHTKLPAHRKNCCANPKCILYIPKVSNLITNCIQFSKAKFLTKTTPEQCDSYINWALTRSLDAHCFRIFKSFARESVLRYYIHNIGHDQAPVQKQYIKSQERIYQDEFVVDHICARFGSVKKSSSCYSEAINNEISIFDFTTVIKENRDALDTSPKPLVGPALFSAKFKKQCVTYEIETEKKLQKKQVEKTKLVIESKKTPLKLPIKEFEEKIFEQFAKIRKQELLDLLTTPYEDESDIEVDAEDIEEISIEVNEAIQKMKDRRRRMRLYTSNRVLEPSKTCDPRVTSMLSAVDVLAEAAKMIPPDQVPFDNSWKLEKNGDFYHSAHLIGNINNVDFASKFNRFIETDFEIVVQQAGFVDSVLHQQISKMVSEKFHGDPIIKAYLISNLVDMIIGLASSTLALVSSIQHKSSWFVILTHSLALISKVTFMVLSFLMVQKGRKLMHGLQESQLLKSDLETTIAYYLSQLVPPEFYSEIEKILDLKDVTLCPSREAVDNYKANKGITVARFAHSIGKKPRFSSSSGSVFVPSNKAITSDCFERYLIEFYKKHSAPVIFREAAVYCKSRPSQEREILSSKFEINAHEINLVIKNFARALFDKWDTLHYLYFAKHCISHYLGQEPLPHYCNQEFRSIYINLYNLLKHFGHITDCPIERLIRLECAALLETFTISRTFLEENDLISEIPDMFCTHDEPPIPIVDASIDEVIQELSNFFPQQQALTDISLGSVLSICCGTTAVGMAIYDSVKGNDLRTGIQAKLVLGRNTSRALKENVKDMQELVEEISYDVFGYAIGSKFHIREQGEKLLETMNGFLSKSDDDYCSHVALYFEFRDHVDRVDSFVKRLTCKSAELVTNESLILKNLTTALVTADGRMCEINDTFKKISERQAPIWTHIYGREGAGKSQFILRYIVPELSKYLNSTNGVYSLNLDDDGNSFFPKYLGQAIAFTDEFWKSGPNDKLNGKLTNILNTGPYVMEGAGLREKNQMCNFKVFLTASNFACFDLNAQPQTSWTKAWFNPLLDRQKHIHVVNVNQYVGDAFIIKDREAVGHSSTFDELRFYEYRNQSKTCRYDAAMQRQKDVSKNPIPDTFMTYDYDAENNKFNPAFVSQGIVYNKWYKMTHITDQIYFRSLSKEMVIEEMKSRLTDAYNNFVESSTKRCEDKAQKMTASGGALDVEVFKRELKLEGVSSQVIDSYLQSRPPQQQAQHSSTQHMIVTLYGPPDVGKSTMADHIVEQFQSIHPQLQALKISSPEQADKEARRLGIFVTDDLLNKDEGMFYMDIISKLIPGSLVVNTTNLDFEERQLSMQYSQNNYRSMKEMRWYIRPFAFMGSKFHKTRAFIPIDVKSSQNRRYVEENQPGWYRRIGAPGVCMPNSEYNAIMAKYHRNTQSMLISALFTTFGSSTAIFFLSLLGVSFFYTIPCALILQIMSFIFFGNYFFGEEEDFAPLALSSSEHNFLIQKTSVATCKLSKKSLNVPDSEIISLLNFAYENFTQSLNQIHIVESKREWSQPPADVEVVCDEMMNLPKLLNDPKNVLAALGRQSGVPRINLSRRIYGRQFTTCIENWAVPNKPDVDAVIESAKRTYMQLMRIGTDLSVTVTTRDFKAYGVNGTIKWWRQSDIGSIWACHEQEISGIKCVTFSNAYTSFSIDMPSVVATLRGESKVLKRIRNFIKPEPETNEWWKTGEIPDGNITIEERKLIRSLAHHIQNLPSFKTIKVDVKLQETSMAEIAQEIVETKSAFDKLCSSTTIGIIAAVCGVFGIGMMAYATYRIMTDPKEVAPQTDAQRISAALKEGGTIPISWGEGAKSLRGSTTPMLNAMNSILCPVKITQMNGYTKSCLTKKAFTENVKEAIINYLNVNQNIPPNMLQNYTFVTTFELTELLNSQFDAAESLGIPSTIVTQQSTVSIDRLLICNSEFFPETDTFGVFRVTINGTFSTPEGRVMQIKAFEVLLTYDEVTKTFRVSDLGMTDEAKRFKITIDDTSLIQHINTLWKRIYEGSDSLLVSDFAKPICQMGSDSDGKRKRAMKKNVRMVYSQAVGVEITKFGVSFPNTKPTQTSVLGVNSINNSFNKSVRNKLEVIKKNLVVVRNPVNGLKQYGIAICKNFIVMNNHTTAGANIIEVQHNYNGMVVFDSAEVVHVDKINDVCVIRLIQPRNFFKDIRSYFVEEQFYKLLRGNGMFMRVDEENQATLFKTNLTVEERYNHGIDIIDPFGRDSRHEGRVVVSRALASGFSSVAGDCGNPYLIEWSDGMELRIVGIQTLGVFATQKAYASFISRQMLDSYINSIEETENVAVIQQAANPTLMQPVNPTFLNVETRATPTFVDPYFNQIIENTRNEDLPYEEWPLFRPNRFDYGVIPDSNTTFLGYTNRTAFSNQLKSKHIPSIFVDRLEELEIPCPKLNAVFNIRDVEDDSKLIHDVRTNKPSIILTQASFYNDKIKVRSEMKHVLSICADQLTDMYRFWYDTQKHMRLASESEVINGFFTTGDGLHGYVEGIDMKTSPGAYFVGNHNLHDKSMLFEPDDETTLATQNFNNGRQLFKFSNNQFGRIARKRYHAKHQQSRAGNWFAFPCKASLKDETLKVEKVKYGLTRLFEASDVCDVLFDRTYGMALAALMKRYHLRGPCKVGIDAAKEFHYLYRELQRMSDVGEAGDFKNWDKHILAEVIHYFVSMLRDLFHDVWSSEEKLMYRHVWKIIYLNLSQSISFIDGFLVQHGRGVKSGTFWTVYVNSYANDLMHCACVYTIFSRLPPKIREQKQISLSVDFIYKVTTTANYGDDKLTSIAREFVDVINFSTMKDVYEKDLGIEYTDPDKGQEIYEVKPLNQMQFLSRRFNVEDSTQYVLPTLKDSSLLAQFWWATVGDNRSLLASMLNLRKELQLVPKIEYDFYRNLFNEYVELYYEIYGSTSEILPLPSFEVNLAIVTADLFHPRQV